jgi:hypothetical protein
LFTEDLTKILRKAALVAAGRGWFATNSYGGLSTGRNQVIRASTRMNQLGDVYVVVKLSIFIK